MPENPVNYEETPTRYTHAHTSVCPGPNKMAVVFFLLSPPLPPSALVGRGRRGILMKIQIWLHNGGHGRSVTPKTNGGGLVAKAVAGRGRQPSRVNKKIPPSIMVKMLRRSEKLGSRGCRDWGPRESMVEQGPRVRVRSGSFVDVLGSVPGTRGESKSFILFLVME